LIPSFADNIRIIPCPEVVVVDIEHILTVNMLHPSTECCVKRAYPQCVDVIAVHKIASTRMIV
jgi:hypothetical protein